MKKVAIYVRVSTLDQAVEGYSIPEQIERLTKYCEAHGWIIYKIYTDAGRSGENTDRPALQELFEDCKKHKFDTVLVYKLDRLSRHLKDILCIVEDVFLPNGIDFVSMNESFDTATSSGRASVGMLGVFAQFEREQTKERTAMGREGRAKQGKWHGGGNVPIGYISVNGELIPDEYEAMQVRKIFELALKGHSMSQISRMMAAAGYTHKYGGYKAGYNTVPKMLRNPIYIGKIKYRNGYVDGIHQPLIDQDTFATVQKRMRQIAEDWNSKKRTHAPATYLLSDLCKCGTCGASYAGHNVGAKEYRYTVYKCANRAYAWRNQTPPCPAPIIQTGKLDAAVLDQVRLLQLNPESFDSLSQSPESTQDKVAVLKTRLGDVQKQIQRTIKLYSLGVVDDADIETRLQSLYAEQTSLSDEIESAADAESDRDEIKRALSMAVIDDMSDTELRQLLRSLIDHIVIKGADDIEIHWAF